MNNSQKRSANNLLPFNCLTLRRPLFFPSYLEAALTASMSIVNKLSMFWGITSFPQVKAGLGRLRIHKIKETISALKGLVGVTEAHKEY